MAILIDIESYPVKDVLDKLLLDKTTGGNIILAAEVCCGDGGRLEADTPVTVSLLREFGRYVLQLRVSKSPGEQAERTRKRAEVFTPAWICNKMNNYCDAEWFGREGVFNTENGRGWEPSEAVIPFASDREWQKYVDSRRLEITCGEAPYLVSRYDAADGRPIPLPRRIGILDRKLRVVSENTDNEKDWLKWCLRAFQSVYGYELQGDSLLIARINLLTTFTEYLQARWQRRPTAGELNAVADIIVWNLWQMDGLTGTVPFAGAEAVNVQLEFFGGSEPAEAKGGRSDCLIRDWRSKKSVAYKSLLKEAV